MYLIYYNLSFFDELIHLIFAKNLILQTFGHPFNIIYAI